MKGVMVQSPATTAPSGRPAADFLHDLTHSPTSQNLTPPTINLPQRRYIEPLSCRRYDDFRDIQPNIASQIQQTPSRCNAEYSAQAVGFGVDIDQEYPAITLPRYFSGQVQRDEALTFALQSARDHYDVLYARRNRTGISKTLTKHSVLDDPKLL